MRQFIEHDEKTCIYRMFIGRQVKGFINVYFEIHGTDENMTVTCCEYVKKIVVYDDSDSAIYESSNFIIKNSCIIIDLTKNDDYTNSVNTQFNDTIRDGIDENDGYTYVASVYFYLHTDFIFDFDDIILNYCAILNKFIENAEYKRSIDADDSFREIDLFRGERNSRHPTYHVINGKKRIRPYVANDEECTVYDKNGRELYSGLFVELNKMLWYKKLITSIEKYVLFIEGV